MHIIDCIEFYIYLLLYVSTCKDAIFVSFALYIQLNAFLSFHFYILYNWILNIYVQYNIMYNWLDIYICNLHTCPVTWWSSLCGNIHRNRWPTLLLVDSSDGHQVSSAGAQVMECVWGDSAEQVVVLCSVGFCIVEGELQTQVGNIQGQAAMWFNNN